MGSDEEAERLKKKMMEEMMEKKQEPGIDYPDGPITITDTNFSELVNKYPVVLVDFWAEWCGPCKMMEPIFERLADEYQGKAVFGKLNVDDNRRTSEHFQVTGIPTTMIFKDGEAVDRITGAVPENQLKKKLNKYV